jgi:hypothetical protein
VINLRDPEARRGLRNVLLFIVVLALLADLAWLIHILRSNSPSEEKIALGSLVIIGLFVLGIITENVGRVSVDIANIKASMGGDDEQKPTQ